MTNRDADVKRRVMQLSPRKCLICGYDQCKPSGEPLLEGAHIRDFSDGSQFDIPENMVLLCPTHHREYDCGLIDFDKNGTIYHYDETNEYHLKTVQYRIQYVKPGYIEYHNHRSEVGVKHGL